MNKILIDEEGVSRILKRISHEIVEKNRGLDDVVLIGLITRGHFLAQRVRDNLLLFEGVELPCFYLNITSFRDDRIPTEHPQVSDCSIDLTGKTVIMVDDVIFTGRTVRAALDAIRTLGRPERIELFNMIDRGHRELPIKPDFVGKNIPTSREEKVQVLLKEIDGKDEIIIVNES